MGSREQLLEACGKLFNKREMMFQHSTWKKMFSHQSCLTNNEINGYLLTKKLGSGTVGEVYKACKCTGDKVCSFASCVAVKKPSCMKMIWSFIKKDRTFIQKRL